MVNVPLAAEALFHLGSFPVTNALVNALVALALFVIVALLLSRVHEQPGRFQNFVELLLEKVLEFFDQVTGDRRKTRQFLPLVGTLFFFILLSNWLGLLPGTGSIGLWKIVHGEREFIPLLRPANSDLNLTLAMAVVTVLASHMIGITSLGWWTHINKFFQIRGLWQALRSLKPLGILTAFVEAMVGVIEFFGEFAKLASLSLRLFGNIFAGEVLMTVIASLVAYFVPLPFMALEIIVGLVQAVVFSMLTLVYLTLMSMPPHGADHARHDEHAVPETA